MPLEEHPRYLVSCYCGDWELHGLDEAKQLEKREDRWLLSAWLRYRHERVRQPFRYSEREDGQLPTNLREPPVRQKIDDTLLAIADMSEGFGSIVFVDPYRGFAQRVWARDGDEATSLLEHLVEAGLATHKGGGVSLNGDGWNRVEQLRPIGASGRKAFVAMSFACELESAFIEGIEPALTACGYEPYRIDREHFAERIDDHLLAEIRRAAIVVVDCTGHRHNVYFEAGFALGLGIPIVWSCQSDDVGNLHFDVRQYPCLVWKDPAELRQQLEDRIAALYPLQPSTSSH